MLIRPWGRFVVAVVHVWLLDLSLRHGIDWEGATSNELRHRAIPQLQKFIEKNMIARSDTS